MNRSALGGLVGVAVAATLASCASVVLIDDSAGASSVSMTTGSGGAGGASSVGTSGIGAAIGVGGSGGAGGSTVTGVGGTGGSIEVPVPDQVVAYQINAAHTGAQSDDTLMPPLTQRWSVDLEGTVSYPLIAGGRVFVTVSNKPLAGSRLYALDKETGTIVWGPVKFEAPSGGSHATYAAGRVFVQTTTGLLCAFDAGSGDQIWCVQLKKFGLYDAPPTAFGDKVYVSGALLITAVSQASGQVLWTSAVVSGLRSAPTVSKSGVYASYLCHTVYDFEPTTGALLWKTPTASSCGSGHAAALFEGVLYARADFGEFSLALDSTTGAMMGEFKAERSPAFHAGHGFFILGKVLSASAVPSFEEAWSFTAAAKLSMAPIVVNGRVYVGSVKGQLYALDEKSGAVVWSADVGGQLPSLESDSLSEPLPGLAVGGGALIVPAEHRLLAYW